MKKSRLYLSATLAGISVFLFLTVISSRFIQAERQTDQPVRPSAQELAALSGFTSIETRGNFALELRQQATFDVEFISQGTLGALNVELVGNTLHLSGFDHQGDTAVGVVRIGLPVLESLTLASNGTVSVSGFSAEQMTISARGVYRLILQNNTLNTLTLFTSGVRNLDLQENTITVRELDLRNTNTLLTETLASGQN